jgi:hypothetical protein
MDEALLAEHVDAVHAVALADFVAERTARARTLRSDGHREEAALLAKVRKPTVAAWSVNQVARRHRDEVAELIEAGRALQQAQARAAGGRGADGLRSATRRVRELAADLADHAARVLAEVGAAAQHRTEAEQTLFAAATDPELHDTLRRGVFDRGVEAAGFGTVPAVAVVAPQPHEADDAPEPPRDTEREVEAARRALEDRRAALRRAIVHQQRRVDRDVERAAELGARADDLLTRARDAAAVAADGQEELARLTADLSTVEEELGDGAGAG